MGGTETKVLLDGVVKAFNKLIGHLGQHGIVSGVEMYVQPHVDLSLQTVAMRAAGWEIDFEQVAAVSGACAPFGYQRDAFMCKYAFRSLDPDARIAEATGYGFEWRPFEGAEAAWEIIRDEIAAGRPVRGWHWEGLMFGGFEEAGDTQERRVYVMVDGPETFGRWWSWTEFGEWVDLQTEWKSTFLGCHTGKVETSDPAVVAQRVIAELVAWGQGAPEAIQAKYPEATFGLAAMAAYADDCENVDQFPEWTVCHGINPQTGLRNATAVYLTRVANEDLFSTRVNRILPLVAGHYRSAYCAWKELYTLLGHHAPEGAARDQDRRRAGAEAAREAMRHEEAALKMLARALEMIE